MSRKKFEATLGQACIRVDRAIFERGKAPNLEEARRSLDQVLNSSKDGPRLKALRSQLERAADVLSLELDDANLREDLWDCLDYVDYRA